ncbi:MAG TPA: hypothetical protein VFV58_33965, partial [Blastocatellia bacterium]|nr:hypothetical protein [Blastocatellia bacterium]
MVRLVAVIKHHFEHPTGIIPVVSGQKYWPLPRDVEQRVFITVSDAFDVTAGFAKSASGFATIGFVRLRKIYI